MGRKGSTAVKNMSEQFKGISGGDPSRHPEPVTVTFHCVICGKPGSAKTKKPKHFTPPKTCSSDCTSALVGREAESLIRYAIGRNNTPQSGSISRQMARQVIAANIWREQAEIGRVRKVRIVCVHCGKESENFTTHKSSNTQVSRFCSWDCKKSNDANLPTGVICRSSGKTAHLTFDEAQQSAMYLNTQLILVGDIEGVIPYLCSCEKWHVGHSSKSAWHEPAKAAIACMNERTLDLIQYRKGLRRRNR
jgi:hypothetical protein